MVPALKRTKQGVKTMKEMKEIIFGNDMFILRDNLVTSSILPKKADQLGPQINSINEMLLRRAECL